MNHMPSDKDSAPGARQLSSERFARLVADLSPAGWAVTRRRIDVIEGLIATENRPWGAVGDAADSLGMDRRNFVRLVEAYRAVRDAGSFVSQAGRKRMTPPRIEALIAEAIKRLGPGASSERVHQQVIAECNALGLPAPGISTIRVRMSDTPDRPDVQGALDIDADLLLDIAPLRLPLRIGERSATAHLTALIDTPTGRVIAHALTPGEPDASQVREVLSPLLVGDGQAARKLAHTRLVRLEASVVELVARASVTVDHAGSRGLAAGAGLRAIFGGRIGRIKILERDPVSFLEGEPVSIEDARAVADLLVSRRNATVPPVPEIRSRRG